MTDQVSYQGSPLAVSLQSDGISEEKAKKLKCTMAANNSRFEASVDCRLLWDTNKEGLTIYKFDEWVDAETGEHCQVWCPPDPEARALKDYLTFTISLDN